jgi:hypothetical protein
MTILLFFEIREGRHKEKDIKKKTQSEPTLPAKLP